MLKSLALPVAFVDLETTGGNVVSDRIIEIGIIVVSEHGIDSWSSLVNPRQRISPTIQRITGISNKMLEGAPYFEQIAKDVFLRLEGKLFIAHNVRFDYGFLRNEFSRLSFAFKSKTLCTVKLSRALYPEYAGHSLEKIIQRHQIFVKDRHRALSDAYAAYRFFQIAEEEKGIDLLKKAILNQGKHTSLPSNISKSTIEKLPNTPGVYYFWGESGELLYIGKSVNIRKRVLSHFTSDHKSSKEMKLCQQTKNVTSEETLGELSALILESQQIKKLQPLYNRKLRRLKSLFTIQLNEDASGLIRPSVLELNDNQAIGGRQYGLFNAPASAKSAIKDICHSAGLCYQVCGLESENNRACIGYQLKKCRGYCVGKEKPLAHNIRLTQSFADMGLKVWPYKSPIAIVENQRLTDGLVHSQAIIVDNWRVIGIAQSQEDIEAILNTPTAQALDRDIYRYLVNAIFVQYKRYTIKPLGQDR